VRPTVSVVARDDARFKSSRFEKSLRSRIEGSVTRIYFLPRAFLALQLDSTSWSTLQERVRGSPRDRESRISPDRGLVQVDNRARGIALSSPATLELCPRRLQSQARAAYLPSRRCLSHKLETDDRASDSERREERRGGFPGIRLVRLRAKCGRVNIITTALCPAYRRCALAELRGRRCEPFGGIYVEAVSPPRESDRGGGYSSLHDCNIVATAIYS